jgi:hypothetical protein
VARGLGISAEESRKFEIGSAAQHREKTITTEERHTLITRMVNQGVDAAAMRRWNETHTGKERIKFSDVTAARKRRRKTEKEIRTQNVGAY